MSLYLKVFLLEVEEVVPGRQEEGEHYVDRQARQEEKPDEDYDRHLGDEAVHGLHGNRCHDPVVVV